MKAYPALPLMIFILLSALTSSEASEAVTFATSYSDNGTVLEYKADKDRLFLMPSWQPEKGPLPLSAEEAIEIARNYIGKQNTYKKTTISEVKLNKFPESDFGKDKWYWTITFIGKNKKDSLLPIVINVFVMMDGTVNSPVISTLKEG